MRRRVDGLGLTPLAVLQIPEKLAFSLRAGNAKHFFLSYTMLQAIGRESPSLRISGERARDLTLGRVVVVYAVMPFQLLNSGTVATLAISRLFYTRTPRGMYTLAHLT